MYEDYNSVFFCWNQVVLGILGLYTGLYFVSKLFSGKKETAVVETHSSTNNNGEMPSVDSPDFEKWISAEGNVEKLFS